MVGVAAVSNGGSRVYANNPFLSFCLEKDPSPLILVPPTQAKVPLDIEVFSSGFAMYVCSFTLCFVRRS